MALIICPECKKQISDTVNACPHCGYKITQYQPHRLKNTSKKLIIARRFAIISLILADIVTIFVNYISRSSEKKVPASASIIADMNQSDIEYARVSKLDEYKSTDNEIQRSALFNRANSEMNDAIRRTNGFAKGWVGKIDSITTNHGGTTASVKIRSINNSTSYENITDIPVDSYLYKQLSALTVGQQVTFSGQIMPHDDGIFEWSLTELGSLREPEFKLAFTSIIPFGLSEPSWAHVQPAPLAIATLSSNTEELYRVKNMDALGCLTPKLTTEANFAVKHPGSYSADAFGQLLIDGHCFGYRDPAGIQAAKNILKVIRLEKVNTSAGIQTVACCQVACESYRKVFGNSGFYLMLDDLEKVSYNSRFAIAAREEEARVKKEVEEMFPNSNIDPEKHQH